VIVLQEHTPRTPLYTPSRWYTPAKFWYTLGCTIHPVDKHCTSIPQLEYNAIVAINNTRSTQSYAAKSVS